MNRTTTTTSLLVAALAMAPLTASAGESGFHEHIGHIEYFTVIDSQDVSVEIAETAKLGDYDGPVIVAQAQHSDALIEGYILSMEFSVDAMGPLTEHPAAALLDLHALDGAPMLLTDTIDAVKILEVAQVEIQPINMMAIIDLAWADPAVFDEFESGFGEDDYLFVLHQESTVAGLPTDTIREAHVLDPISIPSDQIAFYSAPQANSYTTVGLLMVRDEDGNYEMMDGFSATDPEIVWVANAPQPAGSGGTGEEDQGSDDGSDDGAGTDEDDSDDSDDSDEDSGTSEFNRWDVPSEAGEQVDLADSDSFSAIKGNTDKLNVLPAYQIPNSLRGSK